jgi:hypothetical protein
LSAVRAGKYVLYVASFACIVAKVCAYRGSVARLVVSLGSRACTQKRKLAERKEKNERKNGRKKKRKEGRKDGRKVGRKKGRKEGRNGGEGEGGREGGMEVLFLITGKNVEETRGSCRAHDAAFRYSNASRIQLRLLRLLRLED